MTFALLHMSTTLTKTTVTIRATRITVSFRRYCRLRLNHRHRRHDRVSRLPREPSPSSRFLSDEAGREESMRKREMETESAVTKMTKTTTTMTMERNGNGGGGGGGGGRW